MVGDRQKCKTSGVVVKKKLTIGFMQLWEFVGNSQHNGVQKHLKIIPDGW